MLRGAIEIQGRVSFLASQLTMDPSILRLSGGLLVDSVNFIQRLIAFVDSTYIEYKVMSYLTDTQLWELLVAFIEQIFEDMRAARCIIQDASETESTVLLWGIMKCHEVMQDYLKHDFRKHPTLNGILVQKILKSSPSSGVHTRLQTVEMSVTSINGSVSAIKTRLSVIETKTAKL
jgi:hypothetical protein